MERTITYENERWKVWVDAAPDRERSKAGLELVFSGPNGTELRRTVTPSLLRVLDTDEEMLREALAAALERDDHPDPERIPWGGTL